MRSAFHRVAGAFGLSLLTACGNGEPRATQSVDSPGHWRTVAEDGLDAPQKAQRDRALTARDAMLQDLFRTLSEEIQRGGPASAITVCKERAPAIAEATGTAHGVRIGRTSFQLRNPGNVPPGWVAPLTTDRPETPRFAVGPRGELGALLPIRVQATCLQCHGPDDAIPENVRERLRQSYPDDQATGFQEGDLRGWFWVEVPGSS